MHDVNLNNEIVIEDRFENRGPKKLATITALSMDAGGRAFFGITAGMCIQNVIAVFSHAVLMIVKKWCD